MATLDSKLVGVLGDRTTKVLKDLYGYTTVGDLLHHYPRRYLVRGELSNISELNEGDEVTILAEVFSATSRRLHARKGNILEVIVTDGSAKLSLTFFNQAWREKDLKVGKQGLFAGKVGVFNGKRQLAHPDYELIADGNDVDAAVEGFAGKYLPMYPASAKMPSWKIAQCIELALAALDEVPDYLPESIRQKYGYPTLHQALVQLHNPVDLDSAEKSRERLTYDEAFLLQLLLLTRRKELKGLDAVARPAINGGLLTEFDKSLPFELTAGQKAVAAEIEKDLEQAHPMNRLLQGEVGSGKTIVALRAMLTVIDNGGQAALLAPTEVLAAQHLRTIQKLLGDLSQGGMLGGKDIATQVTLITGSQNASSRKEALNMAASGAAGIVIGTHALLGEKVDFKDLGLIVVDEQHRFGVEQRDALKSKAVTPPHLLVMTATPIPRTVAMTVFGDLDVSTLTELPAGRQGITSHVVQLSQPTLVARTWTRIAEEVAAGRQAFVVCPRIDEDDPGEELIASGGLAEEELIFSDGTDEMAAELAKKPRQPLASALGMTESLRLIPALAGLKIETLHGRMSAEEKADVMSRFTAREIDVLVSTTVIEVGVDVPNATVMVILDADRFGVSQLHQLRGRVGRGGNAGLCLLLTSAEEGSLALDRVRAVAATLDGFELSEIDLEMRREGDVLGSTQSGGRSSLKLLRVIQDAKLIQAARKAAELTLEADPTLEINQLLADALDREDQARQNNLTKA